jgi:hypothetical protein
MKCLSLSGRNEGFVVCTGSRKVEPTTRSPETIFRLAGSLLEEEVPA